MYVLMDIMVSPGGVGTSVSPYIAMCQKIFEDAGLTHTMHGYGTNVEGEWEDVMAAVKRCHEVLHSEGAVRITSHMKLGTRIDKNQTMADKVTSVQEKMIDK
ncbi:MTH1187 family thiamine-binding protein [Neptunomonas sp.]|uniref:MTH1187 family thiamine-binding protein n=1 Tax=Neptunomonas sp. TaxID=1971898 RepID=UPI0025EC2201|nr:MTH1187 family thiamine-binding protein [Neptunomonas sp.]